VGALRLSSRHVARVWGRRDLKGAFAPPFDRAAPIGEIWFEDEGRDEAELLVKYLFTSEKLSIQVHPDDAAAKALGHRRGKDEAWFVLSAEPGAVIGLGLTHEVTPDALAAAARDGSIESLLDWRPVSAGETFYSPAGTIHAIGGGLSLIEIQQNLDLTYRLYDYGRPRELHLEAGVAAANPGPWPAPAAPGRIAQGREILAAGGAFAMERWTIGGGDAARADGEGMVLIALAAGGTIDGEAAEDNMVWSVDGSATLTGPLDLLAAYPGGAVRDDAFTR
jgi:mannose-6-phosphate isomerase